MTTRITVLSLLAAALLGSPFLAGERAAADDSGATSGAPPEPTVAVVQGDRVNLRVGPRIDERAVAQLEDGTVLLVMERLGDWVGVRVPEGFPAAISREFTEAVGADQVRVVTGDVNLRLQPPEEGKPLPGVFRDRPERGALLTLISSEKEWQWVVAPEEVRAYLSARYVKVLGRLSEHQDLVTAARAKRETEAKRLAEARNAQLSEAAGIELKKAAGEIQGSLYRMRVEGNKDKAPVVELCDRLDRALEQYAIAPSRVLALAHALRDDLESEISLAVARQDAEMAKLRGLPGKAVPMPAPRVEKVLLVGVIHYEETPGWKDKGVHFLMMEDEPRFVLRLTTGGPVPFPDFAANADGKPRAIEGTQSGDRLFGLPVIEVRAIHGVEATPPSAPVPPSPTPSSGAGGGR
jgi:uncharacterized protein YgiM (DUF1202 family)